MKKILVFEARNLAKSFRSGFWMKKIQAISDVSFDVNRGEIFGIVGSNGAGKTTAIKILAGIVKPDSGSVTIAGANASNRKYRSLLGYLPENPYFYEHLRAEELLVFYGQLHGIDNDTLRKRVPSLIERVGLGDALDRRISKFSKGMRQRVGLAQALINDPQIVILDEPQTGLDPFGRKDVRDLILELKASGKTVIFSSHILPDVEAVCDRVVVFQKGRTVKEGTLAEIAEASTKFEIVVQDLTSPPNAATLLSQQGGISTLVVEEAQLEQILMKLLEGGAKVRGISARNQDLEAVLLHEMVSQHD